MPIYEYRCPNGHAFEVFQRMSDPPVEACETCGAGPVQKVLFPVAVHFKGSGFYSTDYGRGSKKPAPAKDGDGGGSAQKDAGTGATSDSGSSSGSGEKKAAAADS